MHPHRKRDPRGYIWLEPSVSASSQHAAKVFSRWIRDFTVADVWVSDQDTHFEKEVFSDLASTHRNQHNLTVAYSPYANRTVESVMRATLSATMTMLAELKLPPQNWPSVLPAITAALNDTSVQWLGRRDNGLARNPIAAMTGVAPMRQKQRILPPSGNHSVAKTLQHARAMQRLCSGKGTRRSSDRSSSRGLHGCPK